MKEEILRLADEMKQHDLYPAPVQVEYDPQDLALPEAMLNAKRVAEYINGQPVYITDDNRFTGMLRFKNTGVPSDIFTRESHRYFKMAKDSFYKKYLENLVVFEWQHSAPDYLFIIKNGISGSLEKIAAAKEKYQSDTQKYTFLCAMETVCNGIVSWAEKCACAHEEAAKICLDPCRRHELLRLAQICRRVPAQPARTFYEGLQSILFCFQFLPDSVGTIDRVLFDLYTLDLRNGAATRNEEKELLAEFFIHLCNKTPAGSTNADRTAECHFAIGGYTEKGEDGFNDLSRLIVETIMELDIRRPAVSLRWTEKTPFETLKYILDCERHDSNKRFAFVNDEPRIRALQNICGMNYADAVRYTMVGCNEPSFPGAIWFGGETVNIVHSLTETLYGHSAEAAACETFEDFYALYCRCLKKDIERIIYYNNLFNDIRAKDINVLSAFLIDGCIESGMGPLQYGGKVKIGGFNAMGITCVIDSLTIIKQFVYDEKRTTMAHLLNVLRSNWEFDEELHTEIIKTGRFFGNDDELSNEMARRFTEQLYLETKDYRLRNGGKILIGSLSGYNAHHMQFGFMTPATPDGRLNGEGFMVGVGQNNGKDRKGLLPLMKSLAQMDSTGILCGPNVCNMMIDANLIRNDEYFEKVCRMIEQFFRMGGIQVQLNYVTKEELLAARQTPQNYGNLKVRVSGYSANFVTLSQDHQEEIIKRTVKRA